MFCYYFPFIRHGTQPRILVLVVKGLLVLMFFLGSNLIRSIWSPCASVILRFLLPSLNIVILNCYFTWVSQEASPLSLILFGSHTKVDVVIMC